MMSKEAIERLREAAQNEATSVALNKLYHSLEADNARLREELAAAQATIARMREALEYLSSHVDPHVKFITEGALTLPTNQDALHEARALECDRLAKFYEAGYGTNQSIPRWLREEVAAHRARKQAKEEGK